ncbi:hypothetical protein KEM09_19800 [Carboxylicivirga mesophila]|uniref:DUF4377 domain-containing protein n=1 Tax=Carboxylicivirga mesophila TaxID=1166478 RepID=A0ABS5KHI3_9BACT|nr:hypothetical protein [Carboxylicivirga mesophila]MBS2213663.1 hypothetical protein [Carboxylicivirga mesophila]
MNRLNLTIGLLLVLTTLSCTRGKLTEISLNCGCVVTEHYIASTDDIENSTKKYTFKNSQLFDFGVSKDGFANSFSLQICNMIGESEKYNLIEIDIVKEKDGEIQSTKTYTYEVEKVKAELPKYLKLESFVAQYVTNIYNKDYSACLEFIDIKDKEKFKTVIDNVYEGLNKDYRETRIADYKSDGKNYSIFGIIKSQSDKLDLFTMKLKEVDNEYEIISFNF